MALKIQNTRDLLHKENFRLKMLAYGISGTGKSLFCSTAPNAVILAGETGHGGGLLTAATTEVDFITPNSFEDLELFTSGVGLEKYDTLIIDGFSYITDGIIKDKTLAIPRAQGNSGKRAAGILELDDYGTLAEYERRLLAKLLSLDKNILVTTLLDFYQPPSVTPPRAEKIGGPDLPGQMRLGSAAMFDVVMRLTLESKLRDPRDVKSRYNERVWQTESDGQYLAKSRLRIGTKSVFPPQVVFDMDKGTGTFTWFLEQAKTAYAAASQVSTAK